MYTGVWVLFLLCSFAVSITGMGRVHDLDAMNEYGETQLHVCAQMSGEIPKKIAWKLKHLADEKEINSLIKLYLDEARVKIDCDLKRLLKAGSDPNQIDMVGDTALHKGCREKCYKNVYVLLFYGASLYQENNARETALSIIKKEWSESVHATYIECFVRACDLFPRDRKKAIDKAKILLREHKEVIQNFDENFVSEWISEWIEV